MRYIDIHSHLNFADYGEDFDNVVSRMKESDTGTIVVGTDLESSERAVELADKHDNIWACIGVHPADDPTRVFEKDKFVELIKHPKVVAVGECGLDFFHQTKEIDFERQKKLFIDQIEFALEYDKPIMIHSRSAYTELLEILEPLKEKIDVGLPAQAGKLRGDVHFFAGTLEEAQRFWKIGFSTSFTGVITFPPRVDERQRVEAGAHHIEVIRSAPLEMLMSETDAPFVAPAPYRGKRNEPSLVRYIVLKIAEIRGESPEMVEKALVENAFKLFQISA